MKNVTLSADDSQIEQARALARLRGTTLNEEFRGWLASYTRDDVNGLKLAQTRAMLDELTAPIAGQPFVPEAYRYSPQASRPALRDDFNERELRILQRLDGQPAGNTTQSKS
jgi:hypothetical protein